MSLGLQNLQEIPHPRRHFKDCRHMVSYLVKGRNPKDKIKAFNEVIGGTSRAWRVLLVTRGDCTKKNTLLMGLKGKQVHQISSMRARKTKCIHFSIVAPKSVS